MSYQWDPLLSVYPCRMCAASLTVTATGTVTVNVNVTVMMTTMIVMLLTVIVMMALMIVPVRVCRCYHCYWWCYYWWWLQVWALALALALVIVGSSALTPSLHSLQNHDIKSNHDRKGDITDEKKYHKLIGYSKVSGSMRCEGVTIRLIYTISSRGVSHLRQ